MQQLYNFQIQTPMKMTQIVMKTIHRTVKKMGIKTILGLQLSSD